MRIQPLTPVVFLLLISSSLFGQSVKLAAVKTLVINGREKGAVSDDGIRTLTVTLEFSGKARNDVPFKLEIAGDDISSKPKLLDSIIIVPADKFRRRKSTKEDFKVKVLLKALDCLLEDETFSITAKAGKAEGENKGSKAPDEIRIKSFTDAYSKNEILLKNGRTTIKPFIKGDEQDDGQRTVVINLILTGKKATAKNRAISFYIPPSSLTNSISKPVIDTAFTLNVSPERYSDDGCPVILPAPAIIQLKQIKNPDQVETIAIEIKGDDRQAYWLTIRPDTSKTHETISNIKNTISFTHACISGVNFFITLKTSSSGGIIDVSEESKKLSGSYHYNNFFHAADFSRWLLNKFDNSVISKICTDCSGCVNYLAERTYEELLEMKNTRAEKEVKASSDSGKEDKDESKLGAEKKDQGKDPKVAVKFATPDSAEAFGDSVVHKSSFNVSDTSLYHLLVTKFKTKSDIKICREPAKGPDSCSLVSVPGDLTEELFANSVSQLLQKTNGGQPIDPGKIKPPLKGQFKKYEKTIDDSTNKKSNDSEGNISKNITFLNAANFEFSDKLNGSYLGKLNIFAPNIKGGPFGVNCGIMRIKFSYRDTSNSLYVQENRLIDPLDSLLPGTPYVREFNRFTTTKSNTVWSFYVQPMLRIYTWRKKRMPLKSSIPNGIYFHLHGELLVNKTNITTNIQNIARDSALVDTSIRTTYLKYRPDALIYDRTFLNGYFGFGLTFDLEPFSNDNSRIFFQGTVGITTAAPNWVSQDISSSIITVIPTRSGTSPSDPQQIYTFKKAKFYLIRAEYMQKLSDNSQIIVGTDIRGLFPNFNPVYAAYIGLNVNLNSLINILTGKDKKQGE